MNGTNISCASAFNIAINNIADGTNCVAAPSSLLEYELVIWRFQKRSRSVSNTVLKKLCIILSNTVAKRFSWMDQDATWYEGRPRSRPHCVRWGPSSLAKQKRGAQPPPHNFWPMSVGWMNQDATWYGGKLIGLGPGYIVLDLDPVPQKEVHPPIFGPCLLWPIGWMDQDATWYGRFLGPGDVVLDGDPAPPRKGAQQRPHFSGHAYCGQTVAHLSNCWALVV